MRIGETRRTIAGKAGRLRNRGDPGNHREAMLERIAGETRRSTKAELKDVGLEATRRTIAGTRKKRVSGKPGDSSQGEAERGGNGETWRINRGSAEGCGIRGNSMNHRRKSRKMLDSGKPEDCIERRGRTVEDAGKPGDLQPAAPKDADSRKLDEPIAGTVWRHWRRGNSQPSQKD